MSPAVLYPRLPGDDLDVFITEFQQAAERDPFGTLFIVPTSHLAREVTRRLEKQGVPLVANAVTTIPGLARKVFDDHASNETFISETGTRLIIARILATGRYPLLARAGVGAVDELATLIDILITRKVNYPAALGNLASAKSDEIGDLYAAYLRFLEEQHLVDGSTLPSRAARLLIDAGGGGFRTVFVYGLFEPLPHERDLLLALRRSAEEFHYAIPYAANPAVFADDGRWLHPDQVVAGEPPDERRSGIARLFSRKEPGETRGFIGIAERRDRLDEVRAVAQEICDLIAAGVRPGEIAVAFPDLAAAVPYVEEVFPDFGIRYTTSAGRPLAASPAVQALLGVLAVPARGYRREDVIALLTTPYLPFSRTGRGSEIDLLSREARISAGTREWEERLAGLARALEEEEAGPGTPARAKNRLATEITRIEATRAGITKLFADLAVLEGTKPLPEHLAAYRSLLERWQAPVMPGEGDPDLLEQEARDLSRFLGCLEALEGFARALLPGNRVSLPEFSSLLGLLSAWTRTGQQQNPNAVQVVGVREVAHLAIPYLFISDLVEGLMPRLTTRLPFATDLETRRLGTRSKTEVLREERYHFIAALLAARSRVYLSHPATDDGTPLICSGFVDTVRETLSPGTWGSDDFPASRLAASRRAGALLARGESTPMPPGLSAREADRRLTIENHHRRGGYDSPYDGLLSGDPEIIALLAERFGEEAVFSPTVLETYADCPFRFYLEHLLGLTPIPAADPDLTARERGGLIHRIVYRFYSDWRREGNGAVTEADLQNALQRILATAREEVARLPLETPAWLAGKEHLLGSPAVGPGLLERFLRHEAETADAGLLPQAFEVSFGLPVAAGEVDPASIPDAVAIPLGGETLRLRGRIDRIDVLPGGRFVVTDYKTGSSRPRLEDVRAGRELQLPLYIRAVETLTGMQGVAGTCYTLRRRKVQNQPVFWDIDLKDCFAWFPGSRRTGVEDVRQLVETSLARVEDHLAGIRAGRFPPRSDADPCPGYCDFKTVCRFERLRLLAAGEEGADETD